MLQRWLKTGGGGTAGAKRQRTSVAALSLITTAAVVVAEGGSSDMWDTSSGCSAAEETSDPHQLRSRFVKEQKNEFEGALREIQSGKKRSHWSWFVFPTPPFIVGGIERGSSMNRHYALRTDEQAKAYLRLGITEGVSLRDNYIAIMAAIGDQLDKGVTPLQLVGVLDLPKLKSSVEYFERVAGEEGDDAVRGACRRVLAHY